VSDAWARTSITVFGPSGEVEQAVDFDGETLDEQLHAAEAWLGGRAGSASESELRQVRLVTPWSPADGRHAEPLAHSRKGAGRRRRHILDGCLSVRRLTPPDYCHSRFKPRDSRPLMPLSARVRADERVWLGVVAVTQAGSSNLYTTTSMPLACSRRSKLNPTRWASRMLATLSGWMTAMR